MKNLRHFSLYLVPQLPIFLREKDPKYHQIALKI